MHSTGKLLILYQRLQNPRGKSNADSGCIGASRLCREKERVRPIEANGDIE